MNMQQVTGLSLLFLLAARPSVAWAMEDSPQGAVTSNAPDSARGPSEYKRADTNFYGHGDVLRAHPSAVILPQGGYTQTGDSYFFTPKTKAPKAIYIETINDWVEPITPPDMPASLGVPPDQMQIREPQGDVEVALPSAPTNFSPVTGTMTLPNGAVLKTGADGTAAVLFGGVDSARLMPNSEAAVQQTVSAQARSAEVDLTTGGVFSKVGTQVGVKGAYEVHTPFGNAVAQGGDFATVIADARVDVWVAQGTVTLNLTDGKTGPMVTADGTGPLKIMRLPAITDPHLSFAADTETLTAVLNFIPLADQKIKALRDKAAGGATLSDNEQAYLARLKKVPCVIKLALVEPPAPAPAPVIAPLTPAPTIAPPPPPVVSAPTTPIVPLQIALRADGNVELAGLPMDLTELKERLTAIAKANPKQTIAITGKDQATHEQYLKVRSIYKALNLKASKPLPAPPALPSPAVTPVVTEPLPAPIATPAPAPVPVATPAAPVASTPETSAPSAAAPASAPAKIKPITARIRVDGKVNLQGATFDLMGLKAKLASIAKTTPDQEIVVRAGKTVGEEQIDPVRVIFTDSGLQHVTFSLPPATAGTVAPAPEEHPADNLPAPGLLMHPSMEPRTGETPSPASSTPTDTNSSTNAPSATP